MTDQPTTPRRSRTAAASAWRWSAMALAIGLAGMAGAVAVKSAPRAPDQPQRLMLWDCLWQQRTWVACNGCFTDVVKPAAPVLLMGTLDGSPLRTFHVGGQRWGLWCRDLAPGTYRTVVRGRPYTATGNACGQADLYVLAPSTPVVVIDAALALSAARENLAAWREMIEKLRARGQFPAALSLKLHDAMAAERSALRSAGVELPVLGDASGQSRSAALVALLKARLTPTAPYTLVTGDAELAMATAAAGMTVWFVGPADEPAPPGAARHLESVLMLADADGRS